MIKPNIDFIEWGGSGIEKIVFDRICELLPNGGHILELGSGKVSTGAFCTRFEVTSVDDNILYLGIYPATYIFAPIVDGWYDVEMLYSALPRDYDLIFVDGPAGSGNRDGFLHNLALFKLDVPIVFHDTHRQPEHELCEAVAKVLKKTPEFVVNRGGDNFGIIK